MSNKHRILIISHGHPEIIKGGGEIAAYRLFKEFRSRENCEALFLAYSSFDNNFSTPFSNRKPDGSEVLFCRDNYDYFIFSQPYTRVIWNDFRIFLESFQPTVVHFHHYVHLGLEFIREVRKYSETIPIVMTLHEYLAICNNNGQMVKTNSTKLCYQAHPMDCNQCFPHKSVQDFQLRELYIKSFFSLVNVFIAPSHFLLERYVAWGIPREKMRYLEYGQPAIASTPHRPINSGEKRLHFGYFGQINRFKGLLVLLQAVIQLPQELRQEVVIDIYGANLKLESEDFQKEFQKLTKKTKDCVRFFGSYEPEEMPKLMANIDWVIVSSIWWENAPLVIKESFLHKRPVICSDIGGMAEKVEHEKSGLHFRVGDALDLANCIKRAAIEEDLWENLVKGIPPYETIEEIADETLQIYEKLLNPLNTKPSNQLTK